MRVLFVGEGPNDVGRHDAYNPERADAEGVVQVLARKVVPTIADDSPAMYWREIPRFDPAARKQDIARKVAAAVLISERRHRCSGTVVVIDRDADESRRSELEAACKKISHDYPVVAGVAVECIEAWTLGAPEAIAAVLGVNEKAMRSELPVDCKVEALYENSGKPEHRPKGVLQRIAALNHRAGDTAFRCEVAQHTDVHALARACPLGFEPFADALRQAFGVEAH